MIAFLAAFLALAGLVFGAAPAPASAVGHVHICGAAHDAPAGKAKGCAACPLCVASVLQAALLPGAPAVPRALAVAVGRTVAALAMAPPRARVRAAQPRGPPILT